MRKANFLLLLLLFTYGCSPQKIAIRYAGVIFDSGVKAIFSESDYELAKQSIPANLKLLEAILDSDPENEKLTALVVQGYTGYALGFVEDDEPERAKFLYKKAYELGLKFLRSKSKKFAQSLDGDFEKFEKALRDDFGKDDVPVLFWTAMAWGNFINLSRDDPDAIADLPKVEAIVKFSAELEPDYFFRSADMFLAVLLSARPRMLGGDPEKGKELFERCIKFTDGKYLLPFVFYARYYAVQVQDRELFEKLLNRVIEAPENLLPEMNLLNTIAKRKAKKFLNEADKLF